MVQTPIIKTLTKEEYNATNFYSELIDIFVGRTVYYYPAEENDSYTTFFVKLDKSMTDEEIISFGTDTLCPKDIQNNFDWLAPRMKKNAKLFVNICENVYLYQYVFIE